MQALYLPFTPKRESLGEIVMAGTRALIPKCTMTILWSPSLHGTIIMMKAGGVLSMSIGTAGLFLAMMPSKIGSHPKTGLARIIEFKTNIISFSASKFYHSTTPRYLR